MKIQRNPERMIVNLAAPVYLVAQVKTAIAGRMVPSWVRAGHRSSGKMRPMSVSAFLSWAERKIAKSRENHAIATKERWEKRRRANKTRRR